MARWLVGRIGDGALAHTTRRSASRESRDELREAWLGLCGALPNEWLVEAPVGSQQAVAELAAGGVFGVGVVPGAIRTPSRRVATGSAARPGTTGSRAEHTLGRRLEAGGESERLRHSRLLLAETTASRTTRPSLGRASGWTAVVASDQVAGGPRGSLVHRRIAPSHRELPCIRQSGFRRMSDNDGTDGIQPERPSDPKRAVMELAKALDEAVWMVSGDCGGARRCRCAVTCPEALASAVLRAEAFADPARRKPLLKRLAPAGFGSAPMFAGPRTYAPGGPCRRRRRRGCRTVP